LAQEPRKGKILHFRTRGSCALSTTGRGSHIINVSNSLPFGGYKGRKWDREKIEEYTELKVIATGSG
jgi:hypothetical protein